MHVLRLEPVEREEGEAFGGEDQPADRGEHDAEEAAVSGLRQGKPVKTFKYLFMIMLVLIIKISLF